MQLQPIAADQHPDREHLVCFLSQEAIARRVEELARQISADYAGKPLLVVGVLKGAWVFMADLVRLLTIPVRCDFVMLSSYGLARESSGRVQLRLDLATPAEGQHILVIEDIVDTGISLCWLREHLATQRPASIRLCALLDKPARRRVPVALDYRGFLMPDGFVVGYGIDWAERYRELPYLAILSSTEVSDACIAP